jgi:hypothetical protein
MRSSVANLIALGQLPEEAAAEVSQLQAFESAINEISKPISDEEALALLAVFPTGEGSCFGLAWSVLHLIESAPGWPCQEARLHQASPWVRSMLERAAST